MRPFLQILAACFVGLAISIASAHSQDFTPAAVDQQISQIAADANIDPARRDEAVDVLNSAKAALLEKQLFLPETLSVLPGKGIRV